MSSSCVDANPEQDKAVEASQVDASAEQAEAAKMPEEPKTETKPVETDSKTAGIYALALFFVGN